MCSFARVRSRREGIESQVMSIPTIHHVQIAMPQGGEDAARQFYGDLLGLQELPKPASLRDRGGVWFRSDTLELHIGVDHPFVPAIKAHVAFQPKSLDELRSGLAQAGFVIVEDEPLEGYVRFYTTDPFGNRVELLAPAEG